MSSSLHSIRVEGRNEPGIAAELTQKLGAVGINLRGASAAVNDFAFDTVKEVEEAIRILQEGS